MKKSNRINPWRLNLVVSYFDQYKVDHYRFDILQILKHLSSIYRLDYVISVELLFPSVTDLTEPYFHESTADLIYFRSNKNSVIGVKEFRKIIGDIFRTGAWSSYGGVDIFIQVYKALKQYPFPSNFYRPVEYPFIEFHQGSKITRYNFADEVIKVIEKEQDFQMN
ncbi:MAG TPA: hypothetical protein VFG54_11995 [Prolixibacteraceae bacterium]|nr:hypothetical protein [Prolixibacteraceae bacterium]